MPRPKRSMRVIGVPRAFSVSAMIAALLSIDVREVQARTEGNLRGELAEVAGRAEDEARARAAAEVADAARAAEELQLRRREGPEPLRAEVVAALQADGHVTHLLEERRVVVVVARRVRVRCDVRLEVVEDRDAQGDGRADLVRAVRRDGRAAGRVGARVADVAGRGAGSGALEARGHEVRQKLHVELSRFSGLSVHRVEEAETAGDRVAVEHRLIAVDPLRRARRFFGLLFFFRFGLRFGLRRARRRGRRRGRRSGRRGRARCASAAATERDLLRGRLRRSEHGERSGQGKQTDKPARARLHAGSAL